MIDMILYISGSLSVINKTDTYLPDYIFLPSSDFM